ncbi:RNA-directed DNA polymerase (Reverse transcriptase), partial [Trifolium medium]|nr:RNA-directed DNA polymerase (Reverse transcriptase) [Trifolium medium]
ILDGVVVINELISIDFAKRRKQHCFLMKVDFERAYDTISWSYLEDMMKRMGFSNIWIKWMRACIFNSTMSVLVNGCPRTDFKVEKGLRQGDPLSPFLFLITAEGLSRLVNRAVEVDHYKGFKTIGQIYGVLSPSCEALNSSPV